MQPRCCLPLLALLLVLPVPPAQALYCIPPGLRCLTDPPLGVLALPMPEPGEPPEQYAKRLAYYYICTDVTRLLPVELSEQCGEGREGTPLPSPHVEGPGTWLGLP